ncbi:MAG: hypothetical protein HYS13_01995 [Planctomycetia bacterium]|nr:hypothetical protein [Planctomycetia bacterium]
MNERLTSAKARAWKTRWKRVNLAERRELRRTSPDERFRQLAALMASASSLGASETSPGEEAEVRERWNRLRKAYRD